MDRSVVGTELRPSTLTVDAGRLAFFATVTGSTDPVYVDGEAARAAGHPALPVPPTFLFAVELEQPEPFDWLARLGVDLRRVLHASQRFVYHATAHAGDTLVARPRIIDVYARRGGSLEFIVKQTHVTRADGRSIATLTTDIVVRHPDVVPGDVVPGDVVPGDVVPGDVPAGAVREVAP